MKKILLALGIIVFLLFDLLLCMYFFRYKIVKFGADRLVSVLQEAINRKIIVKEYSASRQSGIILKEICISQIPDFSKGNFLCSDKISFSPDYFSQKENDFNFDALYFENPVLNISKTNGVWDFNDLLELLPKDNKPLSQSWKTNTLKIKNATININDADKDTSVAMRDTDIFIDKTGKGNTSFSIDANARLTVKTRDKNLSAAINTQSVYNFLDNQLNYARGKASLSEVNFNAINLGRIDADFDLNGIFLPIIKKDYLVKVSAKNIIVPQNSGKYYDDISHYLRLFASVSGYPSTVIKDAEITDITGHFKLLDNSISLSNVVFKSNFLNADINMAIDATKNTSAATTKISVGKKTVNLQFNGTINNPKIISPACESLSRHLTKTYTDLESYILKQFPLTGDYEKND